MRWNQERGAALVLALFALVVIGALVGSTFLAGRVEQQSGQNMFFAAQAREAAEAGLSDIMASIDPAVLMALAAGDAPLDLGSITVAEGVSARRQATRLTSTLFLLQSRGLRQNPGGMVLAASSLGALVRLPSAEPSDTVSETTGGGGLQRLERGWMQLY